MHIVSWWAGWAASKPGSAECLHASSTSGTNFCHSPPHGAIHRCTLRIPALRPFCLPLSELSSNCLSAAMERVDGEAVGRILLLSSDDDLGAAHSVLAALGAAQQAQGAGGDPTSAAPPAAAAATIFDWQLDTRYYTADACFELRHVEHAAGISLDSNAYEAVLLLFDAAQRASFDRLAAWWESAGGGDADLSVRLAVAGGSGGASAPQPWLSAAEEWCAGQLVELVEFEAAPGAAQHPAASREGAVGVARVREALEAHMWPGMQLKPSPRHGGASAAAAAAQQQQQHAAAGEPEAVEEAVPASAAAANGVPSSSGAAADVAAGAAAAGEPEEMSFGAYMRAPGAAAAGATGAGGAVVAAAAVEEGEEDEETMEQLFAQMASEWRFGGQGRLAGRLAVGTGHGSAGLPACLPAVACLPARLPAPCLPAVCTPPNFPPPTSPLPSPPCRPPRPAGAAAGRAAPGGGGRHGDAADGGAGAGRGGGGQRGRGKRGRAGVSSVPAACCSSPSFAVAPHPAFSEPWNRECNCCK